MAGILDKKERLVDTVITLRGRAAMATGDFKVAYASFSDRYANYDTAASASIYFEAPSFLPQDTINPDVTPYTGDVNLVNSLQSGFQFINGKVISGSFGPGKSFDQLTGSALLSKVDDLILSSTHGSFDKLSILKTVDPVFDDTEFKLSQNDITFNFTKFQPFNFSSLITPTTIIPINQADSFFQDKMLSNFNNFKYLPPVNKITDKTNIEPLGQYPNLSQQPLTWDQLYNDVLGHNEVNNLETYQRKTIYFDKTTRESNLLCQFFEITNDSIKKLVVIDFGEFSVSRLQDGKPDPANHHIYFVGKIYNDDFGNATFINIFTLIFTDNW